VDLFCFAPSLLSLYHLLIMGKTWTRSEAQTTYLRGQFTAYHEARQNGGIDDFRSRLYEGWAERWPEREVVFPSWKEGDPPFTKEQLAILGKAIATRKKVGFFTRIPMNSSKLKLPFPATLRLCPLAQFGQASSYYKPPLFTGSLR
jgi:hypothetical protein